MLRSHELLIESSELRQQINTLASRPPADDAEARASQAREIAEVREKLNRAEEQFREAIRAEEAEREQRMEDLQLDRVRVGGGDMPALAGEIREFQRIEDACDPGAAILDALGGDTAVAAPPVDTGAERELRAAAGLKQDNQLPWSHFVPRPEDRADDFYRPWPSLSEEQRATVTTPGNLQQYQQMIVSRVFAPAAAMFLGIMPRMVPIGDQVHPIITGGDDGEELAKSAAVTFPDASISTFQTRPKRLAVGYTIAQVDLYRVRGFESALRRDLSRSIVSAGDRTIFRSTGQNAQIAGFFATTANGGPGLTAGAAGGIGFQDAIEMLARGIDGLYAADTRQIRCVVGPETYRRFETQFLAGTELSIGKWLRQETGGYRTSANLPAATARAAVATKRLNGIAATGARVLVVDGDSSGYLPGDYVTIAGVTGSYRLLGVSNTAFTVDPGLAGAAADNAVITRGAAMQQDGVLARTGPGSMDNVAYDMWQGVTVTRDRVTKLAEGEIRIVFDCYRDIKFKRPAGFLRLLGSLPA